MEDGLAPARGCIYGTLLGAGMWLIIIGFIYMIIKIVQ